ncbi:MAG TPA: GTPase Era [Longimicrobium sp.]|nr:GTPase Era [Longimicrobium sp.]
MPQTEDDDSATQTKAGMVALVGFPNVGKSSLMNRLVEQKLSIVTPLAQTTREKVLGIDSRGAVQMVFVDTPGLVDPRYLLHRAMMHEATEVIGDADVVLLLVDASRGTPDFREDVLELVRAAPKLMIVANKIDVAREADREAVRRWSRETFGVEPIEVSAETGEGAEALREKIAERLPESPFLYPEEDLSAQPVRFFVAELVRETIFEQYEKEVPYSVAVKVEEFRESETPVFIRAVIFVERPTQKAILIGSGGSAIKRLGQASRMKIEEFVGAPVYLDLWVKVLPKWRKNPMELQRLGFTLPDAEKKK